MPPNVRDGRRRPPSYTAQTTSIRSPRTPHRLPTRFSGRRPGGPAYGRAGGHCAHPALGDTVRFISAREAAGLGPFSLDLGSSSELVLAVVVCPGGRRLSPRMTVSRPLGVFLSRQRPLAGRRVFEGRSLFDGETGCRDRNVCELEISDSRCRLEVETGRDHRPRLCWTLEPDHARRRPATRPASAGSMDDVVPSKTAVEGRSVCHAGREFAKEGRKASSLQTRQEMAWWAKEHAQGPFALQRKTRPTRPARGCSTIKP